MLSYELIEYCTFLKDKFCAFKPSLQQLFDFADVYKKHRSAAFIQSYATLSTTNTQSTYQIKDKDSDYNATQKALSEFISTFNLLKCYADYSLLKNDIKQIQKEKGIVGEDKSTDILIACLEKSFNSFQAYFQKQNDKTVGAKFGETAVELKNAFDTAMTYYNTNITLLSSTETSLENISDGKAFLQIQLLHTTLNLEEFVEVLHRINDSYCRLCVSTHYESLEIVKIESGSLLSKILGEKNIIVALSTLLTNAIQLLFKKYTVEGQISRASEFRQEFAKLVEVGQVLEENGIAVPDEAKDNLSETYIIITNNFYEIARKASTIKINDTIYSIPEAQNQAYLEAAKTKLLSHEND